MDKINQKELYIHIYEEYIIKNNKVYEISEKINKTNNTIHKKSYYKIFFNIIKKKKEYSWYFYYAISP